MSTTNPSPCFKGPEQKTTRAVKGKLWGVDAEIKELEKVWGCSWQVAYLLSWMANGAQPGPRGPEGGAHEKGGRGDIWQKHLWKVMDSRHWAPLNHLCLPHRSLWGRRNQPSLLDLAHLGHPPGGVGGPRDPSRRALARLSVPGGAGGSKHSSSRKKGTPAQERRELQLARHPVASELSDSSAPLTPGTPVDLSS